MSKHCKQFDHRQEKDKTVALNMRLWRIKFRHSTCVRPNPARTNQQRGMGHSRRSWRLTYEGREFDPPEPHNFFLKAVRNSTCSDNCWGRQAHVQTALRWAQRSRRVNGVGTTESPTRSISRGKILPPRLCTAAK